MKHAMASALKRAWRMQCGVRTVKEFTPAFVRRFEYKGSQVRTDRTSEGDKRDVNRKIYWKYR